MSTEHEDLEPADDAGTPPADDAGTPPADDAGTPPADDDAGTPPADDDDDAEDLEGDTFPRSYVERIRNKSAGYRTRATDAEARAGELERALFTERVRALDLLADPADLEFSPDLLDDPEALENAARELIAGKPHFGRRAAVRGSGVREQRDGDEFGLLDIMRRG